MKNPPEKSEALINLLKWNAQSLSRPLPRRIPAPGSQVCRFQNGRLISTVPHKIPPKPRAPRSPDSNGCRDPAIWNSQPDPKTPLTNFPPAGQLARADKSPWAEHNPWRTHENPIRRSAPAASGTEPCLPYPCGLQTQLFRPSGPGRSAGQYFLRSLFPDAMERHLHAHLSQRLRDSVRESIPPRILSILFILSKPNRSSDTFDNTLASPPSLPLDSRLAEVAFLQHEMGGNVATEK